MNTCIEEKKRKKQDFFCFLIKKIKIKIEYVEYDRKVALIFSGALQQIVV